MSEKEFRRSSLDSLSQESGRIDEDTPFVYHSPIDHGRLHRHSSLVTILTIALLASCTGWAWTCVVLSPRTATAPSTSQSILKPRHWNTPYSGTNKSLTNDLWKDLFPRKFPRSVWSTQRLIVTLNRWARPCGSSKHRSNAAPAPGKRKARVKYFGECVLCVCISPDSLLGMSYSCPLSAS
jgi:hypothetical protein